ncbi:MAG: esterase-like activity of phytase family protein [Alphaproteobacteria bacterium]|nr:esterase-like activity of phytase family protein [Alphaproteobacteria bacterium]
MTKSLLLAGLTGAFLCSTAVSAVAAPVFNRIASFPVAENNQEAEATSSEIIAVSEDGMTLVYSDSPGGGIGFIDITDPAAPKPAGYVALDGEPTSVTVVGPKAYVGVNSSESYTEPSGYLAVVDLASHELTESCDLGGQPDSVARAKDGSMIAVAIENERDEEINDAALPQMPSGTLVILDIADGAADCDTMRVVDVTGLADVVPEDAEPEYVDFNAAGMIALTMQENNHIVLVDGKTGEVTGDFSAGSVDLTGIDAKDDGALIFTDSQDGRPREPDTIQWLDNDRFVIANEGDWNGGSRSFSILNTSGEVLYDSGNMLDLLAASIGHYPDKRSDAKGVEPEGLEVATFGDTTYIFVLEERSSLIAVFKDTGAEPEFVQMLPSGVGPEGAIAIPARNLIASANEEDLREDGLAGSHVMIYELAEGEMAYPTIVAGKDENGTQIGFVALSGLAADPSEAGKLYAVSDSIMGSQPSIFVIDATQSPAMITKKIVVTRDGAPAAAFDLEGIVTDGEGGFWLGSEGRTDRDIPHAIYHVDGTGAILEEVMFPESLLANEIRFGIEGITSVGEGADKVLWMAIQREWGDDAEGFVKLVSYTPASGAWGAVSYPLEAKAEGAWVGLSDITVYGDHAYIIERDNQIAQKAKLKKLYRVKLSELQPAEIGSELPVVSKQEVHDFIPDLAAFNGYVLDKVEGFTIDVNGEGFAVTDNDGVDDSSGETYFWSIGKMM